jgi:hypothetical protein
MNHTAQLSSGASPQAAPVGPAPLGISHSTPQSAGASKSILSVLRTLIVFQGQLPAQELFTHENEDEVALEMACLREITPAEDLKKVEGAPLRQRAVSRESD